MAQINFSYDPGTSLTQMLAFETAGKVWETYLQDNTTINIHVGVTDSSNLPTNVIGGALPGMRPNTSYHEFDTRHGQDITSNDDQTAYQHNYSYNHHSDYQLQFNDGQTTRRFVSSDVLNMTRANAKALGISVPDSNNGIDGYILMSNLRNQGTSWDYNTRRDRGTDTSKLDFLSTALHEVGHILGFVSGIDEQGWIASQQSQSYMDFLRSGSANQIEQLMTERLNQINPLDLFRYSSESFHSDITYGSQSSEKFFSIDGGRTAIAQFSSGADTAAGGDGYQASHWKHGTAGNNLMEPTLTLGQQSNISAIDLRAMDVIGWDIVSGGASTPVNFQSFYYEAKQELASRIGVTTSWLNNNWGTAGNQLTQDRGDDLFRMLDRSQYDMSWLNPWAHGGQSRFQAWRNFWANGGSQRFQMLGQVFEQRSRFSTLDDVVPAEGTNSDVALIPADVAPEEAIVSPPAGVDDFLAPNPVGPQINTPTFAGVSDSNSTQAIGLGAFGSSNSELLSSQNNANSAVTLGANDSPTTTSLTTTTETVLSDPLAGLGGDQLLGGSGLGSLASL